MNKVFWNDLLRFIASSIFIFMLGLTARDVFPTKHDEDKRRLDFIYGCTEGEIATLDVAELRSMPKYCEDLWKEYKERLDAVH